MMDKIIVATSGRNPNFLQFHVRVSLLVGTNQEFFLPLKEKSAPYLNELTSIGKQIVEGLAEDVQGITRISVNLHALSVRTSPVFEITEITEEAIEVIKTELGYDDSVVIEKTTMEELFGE